MSAASSDEDSVAKLIEISHRPTIGQRLISWASRPPGRLYIPACVAVALVLLHEDSVPGGHLTSFALGMSGGAFLAGMGALRLGIALTVARPMIRYYWLRWISAPAIALLTLGLSVTDVPLTSRVEASSAQLMEMRATANSSTTLPMDGEWSGWYPLQAISVSDGITRYTIQGAGLLHTSGLAYSTEPLPTGTFIDGQESVVYEHISGNWYSWTEH